MDENTENRTLEELQELLIFVRGKSAKSSIMEAVDKHATYDNMMEAAASVPTISDE